MAEVTQPMIGSRLVTNASRNGTRVGLALLGTASNALNASLTRPTWSERVANAPKCGGRNTMLPRRWREHRPLSVAQHRGVRPDPAPVGTRLRRVLDRRLHRSSPSP